MSYTLHPLKKQRLQRSELAVPGSNPTMIDKAADSDVDYIFLDLEDAVAPPEKVQARSNIIQAAERYRLESQGQDHVDPDQRARHPLHVSRRGPRSWNRPVSTSIRSWSPRSACRAIFTPLKPWSARSEEAMGFTHQIGLEALIETALGMANVEAIAAAPGRLEAMHFGVADYAASNRAPYRRDRRSEPGLPGRPVALSR